MTSPDLVELEERTHSSAESDLVGAAGTDVFVFATTGDGAGILARKRERQQILRMENAPHVVEVIAEARRPVLSNGGRLR